MDSLSNNPSLLTAARTLLRSLRGGERADEAAKVQTLRVPSSDGVTLNVKVAGNLASGKVMLVMHGGPGYSHEYLTGLRRLAGDDFAVVHYDQRGTASSTKPKDDARYGLDVQVTDIEAIRKSLGVDRLHVFGFSWGGLVAQQYAAAHPERVKSLTTFGSMPPSHAEFLPGSKAGDDTYKKMVADGLIPATLPTDPAEAIRADVPFYYSDPAFAPPEYFESRFSQETYDKTDAAVKGYDIRAALKGYRGPAMVMVGDKDNFGTGWSQAIHRAIPQSDSVVFGNTGHNFHEPSARFFPMLERHLGRAEELAARTARCGAAADGFDQ